MKLHSMEVLQYTNIFFFLKIIQILMHYFQLWISE